MRSLLLKGAESAWLRSQATRLPFVRRAVSAFMPGERLEDALAAAARLGERGLATILTHLGENLTDLGEASAEVEHYLESARRIVAQGLDAEVSIKLTQLGLDLDRAKAETHLQRLADGTRMPGRRLWIDMESSSYVEPTLQIYERLRGTGVETGVAIQAYLHRTPQDIERLLPLRPAIRLVKGAYREAPGVALQQRQEVSDRFFQLTSRLLEDGPRRAGTWLTVATHDPDLIARVEALARERGLGRDDFEFAMLYGIRAAEQERLARAGYRVRTLISYGSHWFPWYMRRLAEKPSNMVLVARSLFNGG
jgi:proline dehydrogenase